MDGLFDFAKRGLMTLERMFVRRVGRTFGSLATVVIRALSRVVADVVAEGKVQGSKGDA